MHSEVLFRLEELSIVLQDRGRLLTIVTGKLRCFEEVWEFGRIIVKAPGGPWRGSCLSKVEALVSLGNKIGSRNEAIS